MGLELRAWGCGPVVVFISAQISRAKRNVSFCSASASAKNFHFGASLKSTGIKVYSLGINTRSMVAVVSISTLQQRSKRKYLNTCIVNDNPFKKYLSLNHSFGRF